MEKEGIYVGIDVAKAQVDVAIRPADGRWRCVDLDWYRSGLQAHPLLGR